MTQSNGPSAGGDEEMGRLREEVEILRGELHRAEVELEDRCWVAPTILQVNFYLFLTIFIIGRYINYVSTFINPRN